MGKHIKKIQIKNCNEFDLPSSVQEDKKRKLTKKKSTKYDIKIDAAQQQEEDVEDENQFTFSTSLHIEDLEEDDIEQTEPMEQSEEIDQTQSEENQTEKKGKFTVTAIKEKKTIQIHCNFSTK